MTLEQIMPKSAGHSMPRRPHLPDHELLRRADAATEQARMLSIGIREDRRRTRAAVDRLVELTRRELKTAPVLRTE